MRQRIAALFLVLSGTVRAASPHLAGLDPAGIQRGADTDVTITGDRLQDAKGVLFYSPGIEVVSLKAEGGKVQVKLHAAADCALGEHDMRVWTATGITELTRLFVGPFPNVASTGSNHTIAHAQPVAPNSTAAGVIRDEAIDYYSIPAKKGDRISAEVEGMRLGREFFDPWAGIYASNGRQLATNDDTPLFQQDPMVSTIAATDGTYVVGVRESAWGGTDRSFYRLHIGTYPQPVAVYPMGGQAGQNLAVTYIGDPKGTLAANVQLPAVAGTPFAAVPVDNGIPAAAGLPMRVSAFPNVLQQEPDNDSAHATAASGDLPVAFNGIVQKPGERDFFRFHAKGGQALDVTVLARQLGSPLDSVLTITDEKGHHLADNDDANGPDSYLRFNVPHDGDFCVVVRDQLKRGGPAFVFRVEVTPVTPNMSFTIPIVNRDTQDRQTITVPRGNQFATMLRVKREGADGDFQLKLPELPAGVTVQSGSIAGDSMPVVFESSTNAVTSGTLCQVQAQPADAKQHYGSGYAQTVELVYGSPNQYPYVKTDINRLAVSVADEAPFRIELTAPSVPILEDGQAVLKVTAVRKTGFTGPINISMLYNPPGVNSQATVTIPEKQDTVNMPLNANGDAKAKTWQVAVMGSADAGLGTVWVSSAMVPLTVSRPYITAHIDRSSAVQGASVAVTCHLDQNIAFDGKAHIRLMGLPNKCAAPDQDVASADKQVVFNVSTDLTSPQGQHHDLFCEVTVEKGGREDGCEYRIWRHIAHRSGAQEGGRCKMKLRTLTMALALAGACCLHNLDLPGGGPGAGAAARSPDEFQA